MGGQAEFKSSTQSTVKGKTYSHVIVPNRTPVYPRVPQKTHRSAMGRFQFQEEMQQYPWHTMKINLLETNYLIN